MRTLMKAGIWLIVICMCLLMLSGCAWLGRQGITPERIGNAGNFMQDTGGLVPGLPGAGIQLSGYLLAIFATGWQEWRKRKSDRTYKRAISSLASGAERAQSKMPEESINLLVDSLFKEQMKAGTFELVNKIRNGD